MSKLRILYFVVVLSLLTSWSVMLRNDLPPQNAYKGVALSFSNVFGASDYENVTVHQGDILLSDDDVFIVRNAFFKLNGTLVMRGRSQVIFENATFQLLLYYHWVHNITVSDDSRMIFRNSTFNAGIFDFVMKGNSTLEVINSIVNHGIEAYENSHAKVENSYVYSLSIDEPASLFMVNSSAYYINADTYNATIIGSKVTGSISAGRNVLAKDSNVSEVIPDWEGVLQLINTTYKYVTKLFTMRDAVLIVKWYLTVLVEMDGTPVQGATVEAFYRSDSSLASQGITKLDGTVQLTLTEWIITQHGDTHLSDYEIIASHNGLQGKEIISLTSSKQITLTLEQSTPTPFYDTPLGKAILLSITFIAGLLVGLVIAIIILRKSHAIKHSQNPPTSSHL